MSIYRLRRAGSDDAARRPAPGSGDSPGERNPRCSVIVPVLNGGAELEVCLESIREQDHDSYELIVVDDGSTDGSAERAEELADRVVRRSSCGGPGLARNAGAKLARGGVLAFTDADCVLPPDWLGKMERAMEEPAVGAAAGGYAFSVTREFVARFNLLELAHRRRSFGPFVDTASTSNFAVRADLFHSVGGFPTDLDYASTEDMVLTLKISRIARIAWLPDNGIGHHFRSSLGAYLRQQFNFARPLLSVYSVNRRLVTAKSHHPRSGYLSIASFPIFSFGLWSLPFAFPLGAGLIAAGLTGALVPEAAFLRRLMGEEGLSFAARAGGTILARNAAWFLGAASGLPDLLGLFRSSAAASAVDEGGCRR